MKINQIEQKIDDLIVHKLGNKAGHAYKLVNDWCNRRRIVLMVLLVLLIIASVIVKHAIRPDVVTMRIIYPPTIK